MLAVFGAVLELEYDTTTIVEVCGFISDNDTDPSLEFNRTIASGLYCSEHLFELRSSQRRDNYHDRQG